MLIRKMTIEDITACVEIEQQCFSQPWSEKSFSDSLSREDTLFLVCELTNKDDISQNLQVDAKLKSKISSSLSVEDLLEIESMVDVFLPTEIVDIFNSKQKENKIVAYIGMYISFDEANITNVAVLPSYRKKGIGEQLVANAKIFAKEAGTETIFLEVRISNTPAISLYQKMDFIKLGMRKNFYDHPLEDAYIMSCKL